MKYPSFSLIGLLLISATVASAESAAGTYRFDFGSGPALPEYVSVAASDTFSVERGYGFDPTHPDSPDAFALPVSPQRSNIAPRGN